MLSSNRRLWRERYRGNMRGKTRAHPQMVRLCGHTSSSALRDPRASARAEPEQQDPDTTACALTCQASFFERVADADSLADSPRKKAMVTEWLERSLSVALLVTECVYSVFSMLPNWVICRPSSATSEVVNSVCCSRALPRQPASSVLAFLHFLKMQGVERRLPYLMVTVPERGFSLGIASVRGHLSCRHTCFRG